MGRFHDHGHAHAHDHSHEHGHSHAELGEHSGYETGPERIDVLERIFDENDHKAAANQAAFDVAGVRAVNLMSSPGAGKTEVLAVNLAALEGRIRCGIVEGDIETALDADRLAGLGAQVSLLNTGNGFGGECHLDAPMVARALEGLDLDALDLVLIENVGNLVCPAEFEVGAHDKVMVFSVTEGEDKPLKYPVMFRSVSVVLVNKIDLLPYLDFDMALFRENLEQVNPGVQVIEVSAKQREGFAPWLEFLTGAGRHQIRKP